MSSRRSRKGGTTRKLEKRAVQLNRLSSWVLSLLPAQLPLYGCNDALRFEPELPLQFF
jgi:hypothetical protein